LIRSARLMTFTGMPSRVASTFWSIAVGEFTAGNLCQDLDPHWLKPHSDDAGPFAGIRSESSGTSESELVNQGDHFRGILAHGPQSRGPYRLCYDSNQWEADRVASDQRILNAVGIQQLQKGRESPRAVRIVAISDLPAQSSSASRRSSGCGRQYFRSASSASAKDVTSNLAGLTRASSNNCFGMNTILTEVNRCAIPRPGWGLNPRLP